MLTPLIYVLTFVAVVIAVQTSAGMLFAAGDKTRRVNRRLTMLGSGMSREEVYAALVVLPEPKAGDWRPSALIAKLDRRCRQAGLSIDGRRLLGIAAAVAGAFWLVALSLPSQAAGLSRLGNLLVSLVAACGLSGLIVGAWVSHRLRVRLKKIEEQLPTGLDIINRALRAGHPVLSALQLAAEELGDPLGSEFGIVVDETTYGVQFDHALVNFARRTGSADAHFFAVSVSVQAETGGNLAEILAGLAGVIRGRLTLAKRVKALASEGRASAALLSVLPLGVVIIQLLVHPHVYLDKFSDPIFWPAVMITAVLYLVGWLMIYRIINFKY